MTRPGRISVSKFHIGFIFLRHRVTNINNISFFQWTALLDFHNIQRHFSKNIYSRVFYF